MSPKVTCVWQNLPAPKRHGNSILSFILRKKKKKNGGGGKTTGRKTSLVKSAARRIPLASQPARPPPPPPPHVAPVPVSSASFRVYFYEIIVSDDNTPGWAAHNDCIGGGDAEVEAAKKGKKGSREGGGGGERKGRLVSIREGEKGGTSGREAEKHVRQHAPHSAARSCVRSFGSLWWLSMKRWHIFPDFHSRGAPRLCHSHLPSYFPPFLPFRPEQACIPSPRVLGLLSLHPQVFFLHVARYSSSLSLNPFPASDLHVKYVNILAIVAK